MSTSVAKNLENKLKARQDKERLSDHKFADKLGISYQLWQMTRTGKRAIPRPPILTGIAEVYPELAPDVLIYLGFDVGIIANSLGLATEHRQANQNRRQRVFRALARVFPLGYGVLEVKRL